MKKIIIFLLVFFLSFDICSAAIYTSIADTGGTDGYAQGSNGYISQNFVCPTNNVAGVSFNIVYNVTGTTTLTLYDYSGTVLASTTQIITGLSGFNDIYFPDPIFVGYQRPLTFKISTVGANFTYNMRNYLPYTYRWGLVNSSSSGTGQLLRFKLYSDNSIFASVPTSTMAIYNTYNTNNYSTSTQSTNMGNATTTIKSTSTDIGEIISYSDGTYTHYQASYLLFNFILAVIVLSILTAVLLIVLNKFKKD
jgi:hypothetical protein